MPETRHAGLQGSLSWYADAGWGKYDPWLSANLHPECLPSKKHPDGCPLVAAGWGSLLYPPLHGRALVNSIRWELFAKGLEDAEYFFLLDGLLSELRERGRASDERRKECDWAGLERQAVAALDRVEECVWAFPTGTYPKPAMVNETSTQNSSLIHEVQDQVAVAIEATLACKHDDNQAAPGRVILLLDPRAVNRSLTTGARLVPGRPVKDHRNPLFSEGSTPWEAFYVRVNILRAPAVSLTQRTSPGRWLPERCI